MKSTLCAAVVAAATTVAATSAWAGPIGFSITGADDLVRVDLGTGEVTTVGSLGVGGDFEGLDFSPDGTLFASDDNSGALFTIDPTTGEASLVGSFGFGQAETQNTGLAFRDDGTLFMVVDDFEDEGTDQDNLYTVDTTTGLATLVGTLFGTPFADDPEITSIAFASDGTLFAVDRDLDALLTINPLTAEVSLVGTLGALASDGGQQGLDFFGDTLFLMSENPEAIFTVDTTTGAAALSANLQTPGLSLESLAIRVIPAPGTVALLAFGLAGLVLSRRRAG